MFKGLVAGVAVVIIVGASAYVLFLINNVGAEDEAWQRYMTIFAVVEAVLYAAVGWLFGKEVHREQAQKAEEGRKEATEKVELATASAAGEAEKGRSLARAILSTAQGSAGAANFESIRAGTGSPAAADAQAMTTLVSQARSAYPNL